MCDEELILLIGFSSADIVLADGVEAERDLLLIDAASVHSVNDVFSAEVAMDVLRRLKNLLREVESARKEVKTPVLKLTRKIDEVAKSFTSEANEEAARLSRLIGAYQAAERAKAERARREAQQKAREAQQQAMAESARAESIEQYDSAIQKSAESVAEARAELANLKANEPKGTTLRKRWCFEVTDINRLYEHRPDLVRLEPNGEAIRAAIKTNQNIPGLRIWEEVSTTVR